MRHSQSLLVSLTIGAVAIQCISSVYRIDTNDTAQAGQFALSAPLQVNINREDE